jgi:hypothetical protein
MVLDERQFTLFPCSGGAKYSGGSIQHPKRFRAGSCNSWIAFLVSVDTIHEIDTKRREG